MSTRDRTLSKTEIQQAFQSQGATPAKPLPSPEGYGDRRQFVSPEQFADVTRLSLKTVWRRLKAGQLPAHQPGGPRTRWLIDWDAFCQGDYRKRCASDLPSTVPNPAVRMLAPSSARCPSPPNGPKPRWFDGPRKPR